MKTPRLHDIGDTHRLPWGIHDTGADDERRRGPMPGGSSGAAINMLRKGGGGQPMDYLYAAMPYRNQRTSFGLDDRFSREADGVANQNYLAQMANAQGFQDYARASGPGTRYEQATEARQQQMLADAREREQYAQALRRRADGPVGDAAEDARKFDARMELLRSIFAGQGGNWGMPSIPQDEGQNALAKFIRSKVGY